MAFLALLLNIMSAASLLSLIVWVEDRFLCSLPDFRSVEIEGLKWRVAKINGAYVGEHIGVEGWFTATGPTYERFISAAREAVVDTRARVALVWGNVRDPDVVLYDLLCSGRVNQEKGNEVR